MAKKANRLSKEKSPYLLQHAHNPVDWYPWGEEAFKRAREEDKPILLSIGYSTCHWCHVMEKESFEAQDVAEILNEHYISIKVDREERPDVDNIYMSVCQGLTGRGGWPLTIIMTPKKKPFFAGTYFPKEGRMGIAGFKDILISVEKAWRENRGDLEEASEKILEAVEEQILTRSQGVLSKDTIEKGYQELRETFDESYGGFGSELKFPTPHNLTFLLRYWKVTGELRALEMVEKTLESMYVGGLYDHIGFGFTRYSTDRKWLVPHFEKMLYDNALLAIAYLEAYQATGKDMYAKVAREVFTYVLRDMTSPEGGFYSAEDADSEGEEGKFYLWDPDEIEAVLGRDKGKEFSDRYDITIQGNFEGRSIPNLIGKNPNSFMDKERDQLFREREKRIHPLKDDKILTAWNGLMISAMAMGGRILGDREYTEAAEKAVRFIEKRLTREDGRLLARYRDGESAYLAYVDDYAYLTWGLIELYQTTFNPRYLEKALFYNQELLRLFWDDLEGGLYIYGNDSEELITRPKEIYDGATPSGNAVATYNLLRLARLTGESQLEERAHELFRAFGGSISSVPMGYTHWLMALTFALYPSTEVVLVGDLNKEETKSFIKAYHSRFLPQSVALVYSAETGEITQLAPFVKEHKRIEGKATVYLCENYACQAPITDISRFSEALH